jgi:5'-3' exonuclease
MPIHLVECELSSITCEILPAVHALTGCDTTSAIFGIGKKSVFKLIKSSSAELSGIVMDTKN